MPPELREQQQLEGGGGGGGGGGFPYFGFRQGYGYRAGGHGHHHDPEKRYKSLDEIQCFKCGENGHFANKCPKGHLAFLSNNAVNLRK